MAGRHRNRVLTELVERYRLIEALHTCYFTQLERPVGELSTEFFYAVGDILEGKQLDGTRCPSLDLERVRAFSREKE